ncbi:MAG: FG-GAP repeat protein [Planctomycetota bacterium]
MQSFRNSLPRRSSAGRAAGVALAGAGLLAAAIAASAAAVRAWEWHEEAKLVASDGARGDDFGHAVAVSGDTVLIGAYNKVVGAPEAGAAYAFRRSGSSWIREGSLTASDAGAYDLFGGAVALRGDTALIGAEGADGGRFGSGSAYVFVRAGSLWTQEQELTAGDAASHDELGCSVALDSETAVAGAPGDDDRGSRAGAVYVFVRADQGWMEQAKLTALDAAAGGEFGSAVSISGDSLLVGARGQGGAGAAYVFVRAGTIWTQQARLAAGDGVAGDDFGAAVALDGDCAVVGAPGDDHPPAGDDEGSAWVFVRAGTTWSAPAKLAASDAAARDRFGRSVALDGETALVGAPEDDDGGSGAGSVYVFTRWGTAWSPAAKLGAGDATAGSSFGYAVALEDGTAAIGADDANAVALSSGAAYVLSRTARASIAVRNAGPNPISHSAATLPVLGGTYTTTVDLAGTSGHDFAWLMGHGVPAATILAGGQVLLLDVSDPRDVLLLGAAQPGPLATFDVPVPADPACAGLRIATQAVHLGGVHPFALSNAVDLFLGDP